MAIKPLDIITLTPKSFHENYKDWKEQRDTELHADKLEKAIKQSGFDTATYPPFAEVHAMKLNGVWFKANGHSRSKLMYENRVPSPNTLRCIRVVCETEADARAYFAGFDTKVQIRTPQDELRGQLRYVGIVEPKSNTLRRQGSAALRVSLPLLGVPGGKSSEVVFSFIKKHKGIIETVDDLLEGHTTVRSGILAALFHTVFWSQEKKVLSAEDVTLFWTNFLNLRENSPNVLTNSPYYRLWRWVRENKGKMHASFGVNVEMATAILACLSFVRERSVSLHEKNVLKFLDFLRANSGDPSHYRLRGNNLDETEAERIVEGEE